MCWSLDWVKDLGLHLYWRSVRGVQRFGFFNQFWLVNLCLWFDSMQFLDGISHLKFLVSRCKLLNRLRWFQIRLILPPRWWLEATISKSMHSIRSNVDRTSQSWLHSWRLFNNAWSCFLLKGLFDVDFSKFVVNALHLRLRGCVVLCDNPLYRLGRLHHLFRWTLLNVLRYLIRGSTSGSCLRLDLTSCWLLTCSCATCNYTCFISCHHGSLFKFLELWHRLLLNYSRLGNTFGLFTLLTDFAHFIFFRFIRPIKDRSYIARLAHFIWSNPCFSLWCALNFRGN